MRLGNKMDELANQIFIVDDQPRIKIPLTTTSGINWDDHLLDVQIARSVHDGTMEIYFDNMTKPVTTAKDTTFTWDRGIKIIKYLHRISWCAAFVWYHQYSRHGLAVTPYIFCVGQLLPASNDRPTVWADRHIKFFSRVPT